MLMTSAPMMAVPHPSTRRAWHERSRQGEAGAVDHQVEEPQRQYGEGETGIVQDQARGAFTRPITSAATASTP